jgi:hypothetical protein
VSALVLDAEALSALARGGPHERTVRAAVAAALAESADVAVPAAVLAELYRGGGHDQAVDACLTREGGAAVARPIAPWPDASGSSWLRRDADRPTTSTPQWSPSVQPLVAAWCSPPTPGISRRSRAGARRSPSTAWADADHPALTVALVGSGDEGEHPQRRPPDPRFCQLSGVRIYAPISASL